MPLFVLDCSITLSWLLPDEKKSSAYKGDFFLDVIAEQGTIVPILWPLEIGNALLYAERRSRIRRDQRKKILNLLEALPITVDTDTNRHAWHETIHLAQEFQLTLYDAAYLELALRQALPLATFDTALIKAAMKKNIYFSPTVDG